MIVEPRFEVPAEGISRVKISSSARQSASAAEPAIAQRARCGREPIPPARPSIQQAYSEQYSPSGAVYDSPRSHSQADTSLSDVPRIAHAIWLHKKYSVMERLRGKGDLPTAYAQNIVDFARLNKDIPVTVWTDNVKRVKCRFRNANAPNIRVRKYDEALRHDEFPRLNEYVHGMRDVIPAGAKDVLSWKILRNKPGIFFDVDTKWTKPVPAPLRIPGPLAANVAGENRVVLFSGSKPIMDKVLNNGEAKFDRLFNRKKLANGDIELKVKDGRNLTDADIVNHIGFYPFQHYVMALYPPRTSDKILHCTSPDTQKHWMQQGHSVTELRIPAKYAAGTMPPAPQVQGEIF